MADLFDRLGWIHRVFAAVAWLVVVVSAAGILASLYNTIGERRRELAILRSLGARRSVVFASIVAEAAILGALGAALGFVLYAAALAVVARVVRAQTGVVLDVVTFHPIFIFGPIGMVGIGALAGVLPAIRAYATDVARDLTPR